MSAVKKYAGILWLVLFGIVTAVIILIPVPNRDIELEFEIEKAYHMEQVSMLLENGEMIPCKINQDRISFFLTSGQIQNAGQITMNYELIGRQFIIKKCIVHKDGMEVTSYDGQFLLRYLADSSGFYSIENIENQMECVALEENVSYTFVNEFAKLLSDLSKTYIEMRILILLAWIAVNIWFILIVEIWNNQRARKKHGIVSSTKPVHIFRKFAADMQTYSYYMVYSAKSDLKAEVANSHLNWVWWLLEPLCNMIVYVIVFGNIMGRSIKNYPTFTFSSLIMWGFFNKSIHYSVKAVRNNRDIVTKVYIPKYVLILSNMCLNLFKLLFSLIVLIGILMIYRMPITGTIVFSLLSYLELFLFSFGLGMIFLHFGVFIDDLSYAVGIALNMMMFLSGIFYDVMTDLPSPTNRLLLWLNPVAMCIDSMRDGLLNNTVPNLWIMGVWFMISLGLCGVGICIVYKNENGYVKVV